MIRDGRLVQLSVSQVESFDHAQLGGCHRRWWFERARDQRPEQTRGQGEGDAGHALLAHYFLTGEAPKGRVKMGKAVNGAILKGNLPAPGPDLNVELRFDGSPKFDTSGAWRPLDVAETLWFAGLPWDGFIDLSFRRPFKDRPDGSVPTIVDHKFSSDPRQYAKEANELIRGVQLPIYVLAEHRYWPDAREWRIAHHNVSRVGVDSFFRSAIVPMYRVHERTAQIESVVDDMKEIATWDGDQKEVPANATGATRACDAWTGCPHQSICSAYNRKEVHTVDLTPEEKAMFDDLPAEGAAPAAPPPPAAEKKHRAPIVDGPPADPPAPPANGKIPASACVAGKRYDLGVFIAAAGGFAMFKDPVTGAALAPVTDGTLVALYVPPWPVCKCGTQTSAENASRLPSGEVKHIGCKLDAPKAPPAPVLPPDAPKSDPAKASEKPAEAPKARKGKGATAPAAEPGPGAPAEVFPGALTPPTSREALARLLENLATLVRSAA